ncbi:hypothetical protein MMC11_003915 [Xylographa trunciseda]|nr:hypothetical protein [Xylographa trunciseda]
MEAFLTNAIQTVLGERIAQKYINHLNAKWYADHDDRLQKALLSCQKLRELSRQKAENASSLDELSANAASENGISEGGVLGDAASEVTIRGTELSEGVSPGKNFLGDVSPESDFPALTRTQTLESLCTVPSTPVCPQAATEYPEFPKSPSTRFSRQRPDSRPISYTTGDILSRSAELESGIVTTAKEKPDLRGGFVWAGYGKKTRFVRRKSASECPLSSNQQRYEVVEENIEGSFPLHPSEMIGEGSFRLSRYANVDEALQELKRRFGPHIETILQMSIRFLGKGAKVRGHDFTYHDLYCMLYEHSRKPVNPVFVIKTLDDGLVVQEGFPTKPLSLEVYSKDILCPTGDQIYRAGKSSSSVKVGNLADAKEIVGESSTVVHTHTNRAANAFRDVTARVRSAEKRNGGRPPLPVARVPTSRQPRPRVRFACDLENKKSIGLKSSSTSPVVTKDEVRTFVQQAHILEPSGHTMDENDTADHGLFSRPVHRPLRQPLGHSFELSKHKMDDDYSADHGLFSRPLRLPLHQSSGHPLGHRLGQPHESSKHRIDEDNTADDGLFSRPLIRPLRQPLGHPLNHSLGHGFELSKDEMGEDDGVDHGLFSRPVRRPVRQPLGHPLGRRLDQPFDQPHGHPLSQRASRTTSVPIGSEEYFDDHKHTITTSAAGVQNLVPGHPIKTEEHRPEHSLWDYKETGTYSELPEPEIANTNPIRLRRRSTVKNTDLSSNFAITFDTPSLSSAKHPLSLRNRHAPRVGSPLVNVTNIQEHHLAADESDDDNVPDFVDRSGGSPALDPSLDISDFPLLPPMPTKQQDQKEEVGEVEVAQEKVTGGIGAAIAAHRGTGSVRFPGSAETASSNACESID